MAPAFSETEGRVTLWGIEVYLATSEEGSISAAAKRLGVSPSAVSQQISGLEAALGATLLDRSTRPLLPTPAGRMFRRHAQSILNAAEEARAELARGDLTALTTLRLGMIEDFEADVTPHLLSSLAEDFPTCRFLLETGPSHRLLDQLDARALDLVVAADLTGEPSTEARAHHPILQEPFLAVTPKGRQITDLPLIHYSTRHLMGRQIANHLAQIGYQSDARYEMDSYHAILALVAAGQGWAILTPLALHQARRFKPEVEAQPLPFAPFGRRLSLSARPGHLQDLPAQIATRLKKLIAHEVVNPARDQWPWLAQDLKIL